MLVCDGIVLVLDKKAKVEETEHVPTLPDVKQHAAKAIGRAAKSSESI